MLPAFQSVTGVRISVLAGHIADHPFPKHIEHLQAFEPVAGQIPYPGSTGEISTPTGARYHRVFGAGCHPCIKSTPKQDLRDASV